MISFWLPLQCSLLGFQVSPRNVKFGKLHKCNNNADIKLDLEFSILLTCHMISCFLKAFTEGISYFNPTETNQSKGFQVNVSPNCKMSSINLEDKSESKNTIYIQIKKQDGKWINIFSCSSGGQFINFYYCLIHAAPFLVCSNYQLHKLTVHAISLLSKSNQWKIILEGWTQNTIDHKDKKLLLDKLNCTNKEMRELFDMFISLHYLYIFNIVSVSTIICK